MKHIPDSKFKVGDIVVRTARGHWLEGTKAEIISTPNSTWPDDYIVRLVESDDEHAWHVTKMEFKHVYNSPLYRALR